MSSSRFPGKVLAELAGEPMLVYMLRRVRRARLLDDAIVVTSDHPSDDPLAAALTQRDIRYFRGSLDDVLGRYAAAAEAHPADEYVRLTGDCPLADPAVIDRVVATRRAAGAAYASNVDPPTYPDGLDVECFTAAALRAAHATASEPAQREHVTLWMRSPQAGLERRNAALLADASHIRLTIDYPDDLAAVRAVVDAAETPSPDLFDILRVLDANPRLHALNRHDRNEGLALSLGTAPVP
jgi:spore coat polysaccharide biosynthesis protein SpsF (cytidylyltransferase family)